MKVNRELEEAIAKHGETVIPRTYEEQFYERVENEKKRIVAGSSWIS